MPTVLSWHDSSGRLIDTPTTYPSAGAAMAAVEASPNHAHLTARLRRAR